MATEKRLIYLEDAIVLLEKDIAKSKDALKCAYHGEKELIGSEINGIRAAIHILKHHASHGGTVDAVEVVRCRDCKHLNVLNQKTYMHIAPGQALFFFRLGWTQGHISALAEKGEPTMREILFRAKTTGDHEWVYGDLLHDGYDYDVAIWEKEFKLVTAVSPDTVGQFTGRVDKSGEKVFEGDILQVAVDGQDWGVGVVQWCDHDQCFSLFVSPDANHRLIDFGDLGLPEYYEIIGNIHDNPELLGGTDNG